ncbi:motile sperm domain-containing protein 1-like [Rhodnius prolixus]|uniref:MSP domain-containing protein n=1 Tax=Rhodnius prolixus TaxID=13249 RepID=A0A4P6D7G0_RHOPR
MQPGTALDGKVPVFAFPSSVDFYLGSQSTYKRVVTLYNPYEFAVRFKVYCTAPDKYIVVDPEGSIKPMCQIDLVFRHNALIPANCNVTDKFRIQLQDHATKQVIGKKDIPATLHPGVPDSKNDDRLSVSPSGEPSERLSSEIKLPSTQGFGAKDIQSPSSSRAGGSVHPIILLTGLVCIIGLLLPNEGEPNAVPFQISHYLKLVFSYVLGLVTMVIFRL